MQMILMVVEAAAETAGSSIATAAICWVLWEAFRLVRHRPLAVGAVLLLPPIAIIGALPLRIENPAWRKPRIDDQANAEKGAVV